MNNHRWVNVCNKQFWYFFMWCMWNMFRNLNIRNWKKYLNKSSTCDAEVIQRISQQLLYILHSSVDIQFDGYQWNCRMNMELLHESHNWDISKRILPIDVILNIKNVCHNSFQCIFYDICTMHIVHSIASWISFDIFMVICCRLQLVVLLFVTYVSCYSSQHKI